jgi:hypothetical protein
VTPERGVAREFRLAASPQSSGTVVRAVDFPGSARLALVRDALDAADAAAVRSGAVFFRRRGRLLRSLSRRHPKSLPPATAALLEPFVCSRISSLGRRERWREVVALLAILRRLGREGRSVSLERAFVRALEQRLSRAAWRARAVAGSGARDEAAILAADLRAASAIVRLAARESLPVWSREAEIRYARLRDACFAAWPAPARDAYVSLGGELRFAAPR